jgi:hypothetical protein
MFVRLFTTVLRENGPLHPEDEVIQRELEQLPTEAQVLICQAGGITKLLQQSLKFAAVEGYICLLKDAARARSLAQNRRQSLLMSALKPPGSGSIKATIKGPVTTDTTSSMSLSALMDLLRPTLQPSRTSNENRSQASDRNAWNPTCEKPSAMLSSLNRLPTSETVGILGGLLNSNRSTLRSDVIKPDSSACNESLTVKLNAPKSFVVADSDKTGAKYSSFAPGSSPSTVSSLEMREKPSTLDSIGVIKTPLMDPLKSSVMVGPSSGQYVSVSNRSSMMNDDDFASRGQRVASSVARSEDYIPYTYPELFSVPNSNKNKTRSSEPFSRLERVDDSDSESSDYDGVYDSETEYVPLEHDFKSSSMAAAYLPTTEHHYSVNKSVGLSCNSNTVSSGAINVNSTVPSKVTQLSPSAREFVPPNSTFQSRLMEHYSGSMITRLPMSDVLSHASSAMFRDSKPEAVTAKRQLPTGRASIIMIDQSVETDDSWNFKVDQMENELKNMKRKHDEELKLMNLKHQAELEDWNKKCIDLERQLVVGSH